jgi:hypothetical protein
VTGSPRILAGLCAAALIAVVAGGCTRVAGPSAPASASTSVDMSSGGTQAVDATSSAIGTLTPGGAGTGSSTTGGGSNAGKSPTPSGGGAKTTAVDLKSIDAQLQAMQKELDGLNVPSDSDFNGAAGAVY